VVTNSEILLIYEAKNCNPNGDPDEENRPRIDPKTRRNLVSDVRLKRFFRDYIASRFGEKYIFVTKISGQHLRADQRLDKFASDERVKKILENSKAKKSSKRERSSKEKEHSKEKLTVIAEHIPKLCIDARLFGATIPIGKGGEETKGAQRTFIGPVQFTWGFSLHPVELIESSTITSVFSGRRAEEQYGTIGKDWRLYYSLICFYGVVSGKRAIHTGLSGDDLKILDNFLWRALILEPTTRSKIGHQPHLYLRVEYKDSETLIGDLREYIDVTELKDPIRELEDVNPKFNRLLEILEKNKDDISKIFISISDKLESLTFLKQSINKKFNKEVVVELPHDLNDENILRILDGGIKSS